jgi:hypothetical protein
MTALDSQKKAQRTGPMLHNKAKWERKTPTVHTYFLILRFITKKVKLFLTNCRVKPQKQPTITPTIKPYRPLKSRQKRL